MIRCRVNTDRARAKLERIKAALPTLIEQVADKTAAQVLTLMVQSTPKHWFGSVRAGWQIENLGPGRRRVFNDRPKTANGVPIMALLEYGTADGGTGWIYPVRKRALYIPLRRSAVVWHAGLKRGRDFILRRRVRGIRPRRIIEKSLPRVQEILFTNMKNGLRKVVSENA